TLQHLRRRRVAVGARGGRGKIAADSRGGAGVFARVVAGRGKGENYALRSVGATAHDHGHCLLWPHGALVLRLSVVAERRGLESENNSGAGARREMIVYLITAAALLVYLILVWFLGSALGLKSPDIWILRGGLALIGIAGAALFLWYWI